MDNHYTRRSLNAFIYNEIPENVFEASKVFALQQEDYMYMDVMTTHKDEYDKKYVFFVDGKHNVPFVFEKDKDFSILEFAILSKKCEEIGLHPSEFETTLTAQAEGKFSDATECIALFNHYRDTLQGFPVKAEVIIE